MKKIFFDAIRTGRKTTTLRYWRRKLVKPGGVHTVPGLGRVRIESVEPADWASLTDADAAADGFASLAEMRDALRKMYPSLGEGGDAGRQLYAVRFTLLAGPDPRRKRPSGQA